jgi:hypothetical protein
MVRGRSGTMRCKSGVAGDSYIQGRHPGDVPYQEPVDKSLYRQAVGCLLYIALGSRPDIAYAATTLGRYSSNPHQNHWTAVKHLLRYLKATASKKLALTSQSSSTPIVAYADADLGGETHTGKLTTGYLLYDLGILVLWKSKKQTLVAQSTMESELIASAAVKRQIDWFTGLLSELAPSLSASRFASPPVLLKLLVYPLPPFLSSRLVSILDLPSGP